MFKQAQLILLYIPSWQISKEALFKLLEPASNHTSLQATLHPGSSFHAVSVLNNVISVYHSHISLAFIYVNGWRSQRTQMNHQI